MRVAGFSPLLLLGVLATVAVLQACTSGSSQGPADFASTAPTAMDAPSPIPPIGPAGDPLSSSSAVLTQDQSRLFVVNQDSGTVSAVDPIAQRVLWEQPVGRRPFAVTTASDRGDVIVTLFDDGEVARLDGETGEVVARGSAVRTPAGVVSDGSRVYVADQGADRVLVYDAASLGLFAEVPVADSPRALALSADRRSLVVGHFLTGSVTVIETESLEVEHIVDIGSDASAVEQLVFGPDGAELWVVHQLSFSERTHLTFDTTVAPVVSLVDLAAKQHVEPRRLFLDLLDTPVNRPSAIGFGVEPTVAFVANAGSNDVSVIDMERGIAIGHVEVGDNPTAVVVPTHGPVYVHNQLSGDLSIIDRSRLEEMGRLTVTTIPLDPEVLRGKKLFFSADRPELTFDQWVSCASCHLDAGIDGRTWSLGDGQRNTTEVKGLSITAPYHWSGDRIDLLDFQLTITSVQHGTGLSGSQQTDLAAFMAHLDVGQGAAETELSRHGRAIFDSAGCARCHHGPAFTDGDVHDVGTGDSPLELRGPDFDTPTLLGLMDTPPYLHDGRAENLTEVFTTHNANDRHGETSRLSPDEIEAIIAYVLSLSPSTE